MPVPVRVYNTEKTDSVDFRLVHTVNNQVFWVDPGFEVSEIKIDPDYWLISKTAQVLETPKMDNSNDIIVFPNPFSDQLIIHVNGDKIIKNTRLFDISGNLILELQGEIRNLNLSSLYPGMYMLEINTSKGSVVKKVVKDFR